MKKVTTRMVGAAAGVSHVTVSRVLNNDPRVHPATRARVIETAREMGYPLAPADGRLTIALIIFETNLSGYLSSLLTFLLKEISLHGHRVELISTRDLELLNSRAIAGAISVSINDRLNEFWGGVQQFSAGPPQPAELSQGEYLLGQFRRHRRHGAGGRLSVPAGTSENRFYFRCPSCR